MMKELSLRLFNNEELLGIVIVTGILLGIITLFFALIKTFKEKEEEYLPSSSDGPYRKSRPRFLWLKKDSYAIIMITVGYSVVSLWNLGTLACPETFWQPVSDNESVTFYLPETTEFDGVYWISGEGNNNINPTTHQVGADFQILGSHDLQNWEHITTLSDASYMAWKINEGYTWNFRYIRILSNSRNVVLHEIGLRSSDHSGFLPLKFLKQSNPDNPYTGEALVDEQTTLTLQPTYYHSSYFDEVYHPRNAYEIAEGQHMYASVHPLLGTSIMALCIKFFGLNPFAWRISQALFGILMLPLFYLILKRLFIQRRYAVIGTTLLAADFMHYTTSRIGTLEPFSVFFILLMYWFMIDYYLISFYDSSFRKSLVTLALCGITMGIAIATKWTGAYAAIGLAILFFTSLFQRYHEYRHAKAAKVKSKQEQFILGHFPRYCSITILWCCLFFVVVPVIIYFAAYIPCMLVKNQPWSIKGVIDQTLYIFNYHANLNATHPFQSVWYQWILDIRPIWYYYGSYDEVVHTISAFGNPFVWWGGLASIIATFFLVFKRKCSDAWLISISYLSQLVPWLLVTRCVFIYHYYPSVPFMILAIVYIIRCLDQSKPQYRQHITFYVLACVLLFVLFLPVISGFGTTHFYIDNVLRWMSSWYFG